MSGIDWGQALEQGLGSGLQQTGSFIMNQQARDAENQRWLEREKALQDARMSQEKDLAAFRAQLEPPHTDTQETTDASGATMKHFRQWVPPTRDEIDQGQGGHYEETGTGPAVDVDRLAEQGRHNVELEGAAQQRLALQGDLNVAKIEAAEARAALDNARTANGGSAAGKKVIWTTDNHGIATANLMGKDGALEPLLDANNNPVTSQRWRPRGQFSATGKRELPTGQTVDVGQRDEIGPAYPRNAFDERPKSPQTASGAGSMLPPVFVDPSQQGGQAPPMSQFGSGAPPSTTPNGPPAARSAPATGQGAPGSAQNPIPYTPGMSKPPPGTYVRKPDGSVVVVQP